jgi:hypothetical protein
LTARFCVFSFVGCLREFSTWNEHQTGGSLGVESVFSPKIELLEMVKVEHLFINKLFAPRGEERGDSNLVTSIRFMRRGPQPIELSFGVLCL